MRDRFRPAFGCRTVDVKLTQDAAALIVWTDVYSHFDAEDVAQDYLQLLRRASVTRRLALDQHPDWELAISAKAAADELKIRTWSRDGTPATVWAVLPDWSPTFEELISFNRRISWLQEE